MQLYREFQTEASEGRETNRMGPWGTRMLEALQQQTAIALKENVPEQRIKRLMEGTLTALHGGYMSLILRNTSGTYDMAIECNHGEFPEYKPLIQDMPESNLTPRLWDMLYRGSGVIIPDVHQVIDNVKGQWDWEMVSKVDNAILVPFLHTGEVQALLVVCNLTEEACDAYIRFVPLLKAITENMLREFPGDKGFTFLDAEPEKQVEDWKAGLYDTLFYHSDMGIFCKDNNHRYVAANDTFLASYHVTREEILGKTDEELDMHEYPEEVKEEEERILTTGARVLNQVRNITWNGERRTFLVSKLPVWKDGAMQGIIGYSVDITNRGQVGGDRHPLFAARQQQEEAKMSPGNRWKQKYEKSGENFACLSIQILRRKEFCQLLGEKACHAMKESILRTAGGILPKEAEIIQIYKARFLILISCKTPQAMETWENRIRQALQSLSWNGKGKSFPLQVMIGAALYSETHAVEDMVALADSRMKADNPQLPEIEKGSIRKFSRQQMEQQLRLYESVFDYVRLVDPKTQIASVLDKNGKLYTSPYKCYYLLGRDAACCNCTSRQTLKDHNVHRRIASAGDQGYYVESRYVEMDNKPYVLELIDKVDSMQKFAPEYKQRMEQLRDEWTQLEEQNQVLKQKNLELYHLSRTDALTQAENRLGLRYGFTSFVRHRVMVMMVDINKFKQYNDANGHQAGDHVLVNFAHILIQAFGKKNCFRYGGDEFLVIANLSEEEFDQKMQQVIEAISRIDIPGAASAPHGSFGCVYGYADSKETLRNMIRQADYYMYQVKNGKLGTDIKKGYYDENWADTMD